MKNETQKKIAAMLRAESARYRLLAMELALSTHTTPAVGNDDRHMVIRDHLTRSQTMLESARLVEKMEAAWLT